MKKAKIILALIVVLAICLTFASCKTAEYTLDKTTAALKVGETAQLTVKSSLDNEFTATYSSDNEKVATVSNTGLITAIGAGNATITVAVDGKELTCSVTVTAQEVTYQYSLSNTNVSLEEEESVDLTVSVTPNKTLSVQWKSGNTAVATVDNSGHVVAVAEGNTVITATVDGKELKCNVTVTKAPVTYTYTLNKNSADLEKGKTLELSLTIKPAMEGDVSVVWESSNKDAATVSSNGVVTAKAVGKADITAKIDNKTVATCKVNVFVYEYVYADTLDIPYGTKDAKLPVEITPKKDIDISYVIDTAGQDVIEIAKDGAITIKNVGEATVTIKDGTAAVGTCSVKVSPVYTMDEYVQMHVGDAKVLAVTSQPADDNLTVTYAITAGDAVTLGQDGKTLTAAKNGVATVTATVGGKTLTCNVLVNDVNAAVSHKSLTTESKETISGDNVAYWEQYINGNEINRKAISCADEDVIDRSYVGTYGFFPDYAKLTWTDGDSTCAKPAKTDFQEGALFQVREVGDTGVKVDLAIKVAQGETTIKVYTGVFKGTNTVTLYNGETAIASYVLRNDGDHIRDLLTFDVDVVEATELKIELALSNPTADNSFLTLVAVTLSGDTYSLAKSSARIIPEGETTIVMNKNGEACSETLKYEIVEGSDVVSVSDNGVVKGLKIGSAKISVTTEKGHVRTFTVNVGYDYALDTDKAQLHVNGTHSIQVISDPAGGADAPSYAITSGDDVVSLNTETGVVTALKAGKAVITVTVAGKSLTLDVTVGDVLADADITALPSDNKNNPIDITDGAEYWEQYINTSQVNHKQYVTAEEDIIEKINPEGAGGYLDDYQSFLAWYGGATSETCDCGLCDKESHTHAEDQGWSGKGTKSYKVGIVDKITTIKVKLVAGESVIKVYTGGYNLDGKIQLKVGEEVLAEKTFSNKSAHVSYCVAFTVDTVNACEVTIELSMTNNYGDGNSCVSLAAVSVSGDVYQLGEKGVRLAPNGTATIAMNKNGTAMDAADYVCEVTEGGDYVTLEDNVVTAKAPGTAIVKVTADGRIRYYTVNVGYEYSLKDDAVTLKPNATYQVVAVSNPAGGNTEITNASSDNEEVATVSASGLITAVAEGTTTVTVSVDGKDYEITVTVSGVVSSMRTEDITNTYINFDDEDIVYWEHYIYGETNFKKDTTDIISTDMTGVNGDQNFGAAIGFTNSGGPKATAFEDDWAYTKFSWKSSWLSEISLTAGKHEIRVYTGVWDSRNKVSLMDGDKTLQTYEFEASQGKAVGIIFTVDLQADATLKVKMEALRGNSLRLAGIAVTNEVVARDTSVSIKEINQLNGNGTLINLTEKGNLDWAYFNYEGTATDELKDGSLIDMTSIAHKTGNEWGFKAAFTWTNGTNYATAPTDNDLGDIAAEGTNNWIKTDSYLSVDVTVNSSVKSLIVYTNAYQADCGIAVIDSHGRVLATGHASAYADGDQSREVVFDVNAVEEEVLKVVVYKSYDGRNNVVGLAAIAVSGAVA